MTLRVAYAGHDRLASCAVTLAHRPDIDLVWCLLPDEDGPPAVAVEAAARASGARIHRGPWSTGVITELNTAGLDLLVVAGYPYRVPIQDLTVERAVAVHPSLLPHGRGADPVPHHLLGDGTHSGLTIHELAPEIGHGPLLLQRPVPVPLGQSTVDDLRLRLYGEAATLLALLLDNLDTCFAASIPQTDPGSYWPELADTDRPVDLSTSTVAEIRRAHTLIGSDGVHLQPVTGPPLLARHLTAVTCRHPHAAGSVVARHRDSVVLAVHDGLLRVAVPPPPATDLPPAPPETDAR